MSDKCMALCRRQNALAKGGQAKAIESGEAEDPEVSNLASHTGTSASCTVAIMRLWPNVATHHAEFTHMSCILCYVSYQLWCSCNKSIGWFKTDMRHSLVLDIQPT